MKCLNAVVGRARAIRRSYYYYPTNGRPIALVDIHTSAVRDGLTTTSNSDHVIITEEDEEHPYGTRVLVEAPDLPHSLLQTHPLRRYMDTAISRSACLAASASKTTTDMGHISTHKDMSIVFLGTGAGGRPNTKRNPSSLCLRVHGAMILVDVGEGTQKQLALSSCLDSAGYLSIEKILITHLHADHVSGLPGLILQINDAARNRSDQTQKRAGESKYTANTTLHKLDIYGPPGLYNYLSMSILLK